MLALVKILVCLFAVVFAISLTGCTKKPSPEQEIPVLREEYKVMVPGRGELFLDSSVKLYDASFFIQDGQLYVTLFNGSESSTCYKTQIHADGVAGTMPEEGKGTVGTVYILRENKIIYTVNHSWADDRFTKKRLEEIFGSVSKYKSTKYK